jgi:predicted rRNA methylase YqxC with S4 and FtsJ domains
MVLDDQSESLGTNRTLSTVMSYEDGSAHVHYSFDCTLEQLAEGANLTVADASFALGELGLLPHIQSSNDADVVPQIQVDAQAKDETQGKQGIIITRELILRVAQKFPFKRPPISKEAISFWDI